MKKIINFFKLGFKLTYRKLKTKPHWIQKVIQRGKPNITSAKAIGLILFLAIYGLGINFAVNIIEAQGACSSQLTCSGTELDDLQVGKLGIGIAPPSNEGELKVSGNAYINSNAYIDGGELKAKWLHSTAAGNNTFVGNVGIGTTNPVARLDVKGLSSTRVTYGFGVQNSSGIYNLVVRDDGKVGIGTTNPGAKLDVVGYVKGRSGLCIGSDCKSSWPTGVVGLKVCQVGGECYGPLVNKDGNIYYYLDSYDITRRVISNEAVCADVNYHLFRRSPYAYSFYSGERCTGNEYGYTAGGPISGTHADEVFYGSTGSWTCASRELFSVNTRSSRNPSGCESREGSSWTFYRARDDLLSSTIEIEIRAE